MLFSSIQAPPPPRPKVTVFVHGTHRILNFIPKSFELMHSFISPQKGMYRAASLPPCFFYQNFIYNLSSSAPKEFPKNHCYFFCWPGCLSETHRLESASELNQGLNDLLIYYKNHYKTTPLITLIGYSHGGNVAINLLALKEEKNYTVDRLILLASPVRQNTKKLMNNNTFFKLTYAFYSRTDTVHIIDPQGIGIRRKAIRNKFTNAGKNKPVEWVPLFSERTFNKTSGIKHIALKRKYRDLGHREFLLPRFTKQLGTIIEQAEQHDFNKKHMTYLVK